MQSLFYDQFAFILANAAQTTVVRGVDSRLFSNLHCSHQQNQKQFSAFLFPHCTLKLILGYIPFARSMSFMKKRNRFDHLTLKHGRDVERGS